MSTHLMSLWPWSARTLPNLTAGAGWSRKQRAIFGSVFSFAAFTAAFYSGDAPAQTAETAQTSPTERTSPETQSLETVIVTARKREEQIQDIPIAMTVINAATLADANIQTIDDIHSLAPNLNISTSQDPGAANVVLRGIGSNDVTQGVGFYVNDVQQFGGSGFPLVDLNRIEVLRGPQGTLYGGSNIGGAIKYVTNLPTDHLSGLLSYEGGGQDTKNFGGIISGPVLGDNLLGRLVLIDQQNDGFVRDTALNNQLVNGGIFRDGRLTLQYNGGATTALLYLDWSHLETDALDPLYQATNDHTYSTTVDYDYPPSADKKRESATLRIDHRLDNMTLTSLSAATHFSSLSAGDFDFTSYPIAYGIDEQIEDVYSQELRVSSSGNSPFSWLLGAIYQYRSLDENLNFYQNLTPPPFTPTNFIDLPTYTQSRYEQTGLFGNATYTLGPWVFEGGLRFEHDYDPAYNLASSINPTTTELTHTDNQALPRGSVSYRFNPDLQSYGSIARGFTPGGVFNGQNGLTPYNAETSTNFELGLKGSSFNGRMSFDAAAFYIDYRDRVFQQQEITPPNPVVRTNIGTSHNYGAEFSGQARVTSEFTVSGGAGFTVAKWHQATYVDPFLVTVNLDGLTAPDTPAYQASLTLDWAHHLSHDLVFGVRADGFLIGRQYWDLQDLRQQRAYQLVNLGARLETTHWSVSVHGTNVFNERYNSDYFYGPALGAPFDLGKLGQPRLWTARIAFKF